MATNESAQREHGQLFGDHVSTLAATDPDLVGYFDNFAFDEVPAESRLDRKTRLICQLAAMIACQATGEYRVLLGAALRNGVSPVEIKEVVYQAVPYLGIGKVYDFLHLTNRILTENGVDLPVDNQSTTTPDNRLELGIAVQKEIVGDQAVNAMHAGAPEDLKHIQRFLSGNCFGDHYTRTGLALATRELLTFVLLVAHGGCDPQVKGHVRGNVNVGNDRSLLIDVVTQLLPYIGYPRTLNAIAAINDVTPA